MSAALYHKCLADTFIAFVSFLPAAPPSGVTFCRALEMGLKPRSIIKSWAFVAVDPFEDLLLRPSFGAAKVRYDVVWYAMV